MLYINIFLKKFDFSGIFPSPALFPKYLFICRCNLFFIFFAPENDETNTRDNEISEDENEPEREEESSNEEEDASVNESIPSDSENLEESKRRIEMVLFIYLFYFLLFL